MLVIPRKIFDLDIVAGDFSTYNVLVGVFCNGQAFLWRWAFLATWQVRSQGAFAVENSTLGLLERDQVAHHPTYIHLISDFLQEQYTPSAARRARRQERSSRTKFERKCLRRQIQFCGWSAHGFGFSRHVS